MAFVGRWIPILLMNAEVPQIVFVHEGDSWYLPYVLQQAIAAIPSAAISLIGDADARRAMARYPRLVRRIEYVSRDSVQPPEADDFVAAYRHLSTNSHQFELSCWVRWFRLSNWMMRNNKTTAVYLDSDVLVYRAAARRLFPSHGNVPACAYFIPMQDHGSFQWAASAHTSRWSARGLQQFCEFALESFTNQKRLAQYLEKYAWHERNNFSGGICDMTALYLYSLEYGTDIENLAVTEDRSVFDLSIATSNNYRENEYETANGVKKTVRTEDGRLAYPCGSSESSSVDVLSLHFQGSSKSLIPDYCSERLPSRTPQSVVSSGLRRTLRSVKRQLITKAGWH